ncbi:MAG: S26 family signal peptidase [Phycisphaerae bacterium]
MAKIRKSTGGTAKEARERDKVPPQKAHEAAKETIESIVIALVLAFVFRAFIVEAFVIPTGSMAPTLYGAHGTILCNDCGTEFAYGLRDLSDRRGGIPQVKPNSFAYCPNCKAPNGSLKANDAFRNPEAGDRILVLKWPYDVGIESLGPQRWDVTVFKDPSDGVTNFIKRLVGLPNEVLMIADGDVYTVPTDELSDEAKAAFEHIRKQKYRIRTEGYTGRLDGFPVEVLREVDEKASIARKTTVAQDALWLPAYDHNYMPSAPLNDQPVWKARSPGESGWNAEKRVLTFTPEKSEEDILELHGPAIRATCAYNVVGGDNSPRPRSPSQTIPPFVHDLRLRFVATMDSPESAVTARLTKRGRVFDATVTASGAVSIIEQTVPPHGVPKVDLTGQTDPLAVGMPTTISFQNIDYHLELRVDGEVVLQSHGDKKAPGYYAPNLRDLRRSPTTHPSMPAILGSGGAFSLSHVAVHRDVYYYLVPRVQNLRSPYPYSGWGSQEYPIGLRDDEFFMLGDNTAASKDSRLWDIVSPTLVSRGEGVQLGTVPRDQLIGKAFFVYWPSMQRVDWFDRFPVLNRWGVVPDVGRMRWIR